MKFFVLAAFLLLVTFGTGVGSDMYSAVSSRAQLAASFINDSNIINIPDVEVADVVIEADVGSTDGSGSSVSGGGSVVFGSSADTMTDSIVEVVVSSDISDSGSSTSDTTTDGDSGTSASGGQETVSAQSILDTLTGNQALSSPAGGTSDFDGAAGSGGTSISGNKTREALLSRGIQSIKIPPIPEAGSTQAMERAPYTRNDLAIIVSSALVTNPDIDDVFFTTNSIIIKYKSRGRLLLALPVSYLTTLSLSFDETTIKKRVKIKFPWYKFFMFTGVSKKTLRNTIDSVITNTPQGIEYDRATHIFTTVSDLIASGKSTIKGSLRTVQ